MKAEILIEKLERQLKYYFVIVKHNDCDVEIVALNKNTNNIKMSFSYDEKNKIIYNICVIQLGFNDLERIVEVIKNVIS